MWGKMPPLGGGKRTLYFVYYYDTVHHGNIYYVCGFATLILKMPGNINSMWVLSNRCFFMEVLQRKCTWLIVKLLDNIIFKRLDCIAFLYSLLSWFLAHVCKLIFHSRWPRGLLPQVWGKKPLYNNNRKTYTGPTVVNIYQHYNKVIPVELKIYFPSV